MSDRSQESWSSERLLEAAKGGDRQAFGELTVRCRSYLMGVAKRASGDGPPGEFSSVVQEGVTKAYEHFSEFRGTTFDEFRSWLSTIVRHGIIDRRGRKETRMQPLPTGEDGGVLIPDPGSTPSAQVVHREQHAKLVAAIERLPADYRQAVTERFLHGLSYDEIAGHMHRTEDAVRKLVERGLRILRDDPEISDACSTL